MVGVIPQITTDTPVAFDNTDHLVLMDGSNLRRLNGSRLDVVPGTSSFSFGRFGVDRDGTLLLGSTNSLAIARLQDNDVLSFLVSAPTSFDRLTGTPSGAYHITVFGQQTTFVLAPAATQWVDSGKRLDRVLRAPDGTMYAIVDGDIVALGADDSPTVVGSCAEFAGGLCPGLELVGVDGDGGVVMAAPQDQAFHIFDPVGGAFREVALPGMLEIEAVAAGPQLALVLAVDPERDNQRSLWLLRQGDSELLRFATVASDGLEFGGLVKPLVDHAGNGFVAGNGQLQAVVLD
jgi:hypothetical protein